MFYVVFCIGSYCWENGIGCNLKVIVIVVRCCLVLFLCHSSVFCSPFGWRAIWNLGNFPLLFRHEISLCYLSDVRIIRAFLWVFSIVSRWTCDCKQWDAWECFGMFGKFFFVLSLENTWKCELKYSKLCHFAV